MKGYFAPLKKGSGIANTVLWQFIKNHNIKSFGFLIDAFLMINNLKGYARVASSKSRRTNCVGPKLRRNNLRRKLNLRHNL